MLFWIDNIIVTFSKWKQIVIWSLHLFKVNINKK